jgi:3-dehydroquinate synthase
MARGAAVRVETVVSEQVIAEVTVDLGPRAYPIVIGTQLLEGLGPRLAGAGFRGRCALVTSERVGALYREPVVESLGAAGLTPIVIQIPDGEEQKNLAWLTMIQDRLLEGRIERRSPVIALGGGVVSDLAGFAAATLLRGLPAVLVPTTLLAQVDAAIGGKTAIDLPQGKNLAGAFHWPARAVVDPATLETLPEEQRLEGMAEVVKTGLLAATPLWELPTPELVRRCAAYKVGLCLRDPDDRGERAVLNLGHTFAHALEAAAGYEGLTHGRAVALGLVAALRLSGRPTDVVAEVLAPKPVRVDRDLAWSALQRDKKARGGELRLVLLGDEGPFVEARPDAVVRSALDELIAE